MVQPSRTTQFTAALAPAMLSLVGVILPIRIGRIVGTAGGVGAVVILLVCFGLMACATAAWFAMLTNGRAEARSRVDALRLSLGGAVASLVGVPLWACRVLAAATAALGLGEAWAWLFPEHPVAVTAVAVSVLGAVAATRIGPFLTVLGLAALAGVAGGLGSTLVGPAPAFGSAAALSTTGWGELWAIAVVVISGPLFAPDPIAAVGQPRRVGPAALGLTLGAVVVLAVTIRASAAAPSTVLLATPLALVDAAASPMLAWVGVAVAGAWGLVSAATDGPPVLRDVAGTRLPMLERPGVAELVTGVVTVAAVVALGTVDTAIRALAVTVLLTWAAIGTIVAIELGLGLQSFRPARRLPWSIPVIGAAGSVLAALVIAPVTTLVTAAMLFGAAAWLAVRLRAKETRSALLAALADWFAWRIPDDAVPRAWKPGLLIPVASTTEVAGPLDLLGDLASPEGSIRWLGFAAPGETAEMDRSLGQAVRTARGRGIRATAATAPKTDRGVEVALHALGDMPFRPNLLVCRLPDDPAEDPPLLAQIAAARDTKVGVALVGTPAGAPVISGRRVLTLWIRSVPGAWNPLDGYEGRNLDLTLLLGQRIARQWGATLRLVTVVSEPEHRLSAQGFLASLVVHARIHGTVERQVIVGTFEQAVDDSNSDLDVFGLHLGPDLSALRRLVGHARSTCLFVLDSGRENALA